MSAAHLVGRFFGSLVPFGPNAADTEWAVAQLLPGEAELWRRMSRPDRRHSIGVARRLHTLLPDPPREVVAAALLHDVGKLDSELGTFLRVVATLSAKIAGRDTAELWVRSTGVTRRIGLYLLHPEIGADLLEMAGSDPLTVTWAREHHLPESDWTIAADVASALDAADND
ncbi:MAG: HD domain-containing protein [Acidimicrobiia bacterium]|nr:HD domain-containing protein [Acidimicrobiia bacterium]